MNTPPSSGESMDNYLSQSIEGLRGSMEKGFDRVERRIETMVSREVLTAEVSRLDQRDDHLESTMEAGFKEVESKMDAGFSELRTRDTERDKAAEARDAKRDATFARRMTWTLTIVGVIWAVTQFFLAPLLQG